MTEDSNLKKEVVVLQNEATYFEITTNGDYRQVIDLVSRIKALGSKVAEQKESVTKPLNEALKNARNLFQPLEQRLADAEMLAKRKLLEYRKKVELEAAKEEAKITKKMASGKMSLDTALEKIEAVEHVETTVKGETGQLTIRSTRKVRIVDEALIPRDWLVPDMTAIRKAVLGGHKIPGTEIYLEEVPVIS